MKPDQEELVVRVLLADDHAIVRRELVRLLGEEPGIEVVGEAASGREALEVADRVQPDVVLMDVSMPDMDGVEAARRLIAQQPDVKVIGLSMYEDGKLKQRMQEVGAVDYVSKGGDIDVLIQAVQRWAHRPEPEMA